MAVHPLPPYPHAPAPAGINSRRLWFLLAAAGFTRPQTAELCGVEPEDVISLQLKLRLWRADHEPLVPGMPERVVLLRVCDRVEVELARRTVSATVLRRTLRDVFVSGRIAWALVDALPEEVTRETLHGR